MRKPKIKDCDPMLQEMKKMQKSKLKENAALKKLLIALNNNVPAISGSTSENEHAQESNSNQN